MSSTTAAMSMNGYDLFVLAMMANSSDCRHCVIFGSQ